MDYFFRSFYTFTPSWISATFRGRTANGSSR
jgi:hypothetical protein